MVGSPRAPFGESEKEVKQGKSAVCVPVYSGWWSGVWGLYWYLEVLDQAYPRTPYHESSKNGVVVGALCAAGCDGGDGGVCYGVWWWWLANEDS